MRLTPSAVPGRMKTYLFFFILLTCCRCQNDVEDSVLGAETDTVVDAEGDAVQDTVSDDSQDVGSAEATDDEGNMPDSNTSSVGYNCIAIVPGSDLPCSPAVDPFGEKRVKFDSLTDVDSPKRGASSTDALTTAKTVRTGVKGVDEFGQALDGKIGFDVADAKKYTVTNSFLKKGLKIIGALADVAQFLGPIIDIVLLFIPASKSAELKAIEKGFAEVTGKLEVMTMRFENVENSIVWNSLVPMLVEFEGKVEVGMEKFENLAAHLEETYEDSGDLIDDQGKSMLEDLVDYIRTDGHMGEQLHTITRLVLEGSALVSQNERLLTIFRRAVENDCTQILPLAYRLFMLVRNAQKLVYFYEINQGIIDSYDDKGFPKDVYDIYVEISEQYAACTREAPITALEVNIQQFNG